MTTLSSKTLRAISADSYEWDSEAEGNVGAPKGRGFVIVPNDTPIKDILLASGRPGKNSPVLAELWAEGAKTVRIHLAELSCFDGIDAEEFSGLLARAENELSD